MNTPRQALVHRLSAASPEDTSALVAAVQRGDIDPRRIVAILGKTEGAVKSLQHRALVSLERQLVHP
jgi:DNA-directed RNA polymerase specialized sigma24 family protein